MSFGFLGGYYFSKFKFEPSHQFMLNPIALAFGVCLGVWIWKGREGKGGQNFYL